MDKLQQKLYLSIIDNSMFELNFVQSSRYSWDKLATTTKTKGLHDHNDVRNLKLLIPPTKDKIPNYQKQVSMVIFTLQKDLLLQLVLDKLSVTEQIVQQQLPNLLMSGLLNLNISKTPHTTLHYTTLLREE